MAAEAVVLTSPPRAPKLTALRANPQVAVTIDEHVWPYKVLYIPGIASIDMLDDISPEYAIAAERYFGPEQGKAWVEQLRGLPSARIRVTPQWANVIDFETRLPSAPWLTVVAIADIATAYATSHPGPPNQPMSGS